MKKIDALRKLTIAELEIEYESLLQEQFNMRMQKKVNQQLKTHMIRLVRRQISRVLTLITEFRKNLV